MKRIFLLIPFIVLTFSCSNNNDNDGNESPLEATFSANINGELLVVNFLPNDFNGEAIIGGASAALVEGAATGEAFTFFVGGGEAATSTNTTTRTIGIFFSFNEVGLIESGGAFSASNFNLIGAYSVVEDPDFGPIIEAGTNTTSLVSLTITGLDNTSEISTISGTFSFTAIDTNTETNETFVVTNGVFSNIPYVNNTN